MALWHFWLSTCQLIKSIKHWYNSLFLHWIHKDGHSMCFHLSKKCHQISILMITSSLDRHNKWYVVVQIIDELSPRLENNVENFIQEYSLSLSNPVSMHITLAHPGTPKCYSAIRLVEWCSKDNTDVIFSTFIMTFSYSPHVYSWLTIVLHFYETQAYTSQVLLSACSTWLQKGVRLPTWVIMKGMDEWMVKWINENIVLLHFSPLRENGSWHLIKWANT